MALNPEQLARSLERGLRPAYLVSGDEPLLVDECAALVRARAARDGYGERQLFSVEPGFDWEALRAAGQSMSLFAERRLLELRMPGGKPGETGAQILAGLALETPPDTVLLVITGKLDKNQRESAWVKAFDSAGVQVTIWPLDPQRLPGWLRQRLSAHGLEPEPGVVELLAWHLEGNLLAAAQEVDKLAMWLGRGRVRLADVEQSLADSARFSVYQLVDAALAGDLAGARRMLTSLRAEGGEPILVLWALARELRNLVQLARERALGKAEAAVLARVWQNRRAVVAAALRRFPYRGWLGLLKHAARLDRVIKGQAPGDRWLELERLLLAAGGFAAALDDRMEMTV
jgi:DNA polymerase-3 subunit delta